MKLIITLKKDGFLIGLKSAEKTIDSQVFPYYDDFDNTLITSLDNLLRDAALDKSDVKEYSVVSEVGKEGTKYRIATSVGEALVCHTS